MVDTNYIDTDLILLLMYCGKFNYWFIAWGQVATELKILKCVCVCVCVCVCFRFWYVFWRILDNMATLNVNCFCGMLPKWNQFDHWLLLLLVWNQFDLLRSPNWSLVLIFRLIRMLLVKSVLDSMIELVSGSSGLAGCNSLTS